MTSAKTLFQAVPASSSCRLAYLRLKAFGSESVSFTSESVSFTSERVSFANESVSIACQLQPFLMVLQGWAALCCVLHTPNLDREPSDSRAPGVLWQWLHNDFSSGSGSSVISS